MPEWVNPYEVLGTTRAASMDEVRAAYHAAALKYHPDRRPDDPHARQQFQRIVEAYHTIVRWRCQEDPEAGEEARPPMTPTQFAAAVANDGMFGGAWSYVESPLPMGPNCRKLQRPTRDEPLIFAALWVMAILAGVAVEYLLVDRLMDQLTGQEDSTPAVMLIVAAPLAAYAAVFAAAVVVPIMTRKVVYLVMRFTMGLRKALPSSRSSDLPRSPKARLAPSRETK